MLYRLGQITLILGCLASSPVTFAHELETYSSILKTLQRASQDEVTPRSLIEQWSRKGRLDSNVMQIGHSRSYQVMSGIRFNEILYSKYNLRLVLFANIAGQDVPGFDGFLVDEKNAPVMNLAIKTMKNPNLEDALVRATISFRRMEDFERLEAWVAHGLFRKTENTMEKLTSFELGNYRLLKDVLPQMVSVYAPGTGRPKILVMDILDNSKFDEADLKEMAELTTWKPGRTMILLLPDEVVTLHNGGIHRESREAFDISACKRALL